MKSDFMKQSTTSFLLLTSIALVFMSGCSNGPEKGYVTGKVTFKGSTLSSGTITFVPEEGGIPMAYAEIQPDGSYVAATQQFGKGVPVGTQRIMIIAVKDRGNEAPVEVILPAKYSSDKQSGLIAQINKGKNVIDFNLVN
jgi:hypothetical protein